MNLYGESYLECWTSLWQCSRGKTVATEHHSTKNTGTEVHLSTSKKVTSEFYEFFMHALFEVDQKLYLLLFSF